MSGSSIKRTFVRELSLIFSSHRQNEVRFYFFQRERERERERERIYSCKINYAFSVMFSIQSYRINSKSSGLALTTFFLFVYFVVDEEEGIQIQLRAGHHRPISETPLNVLFGDFGVKKIDK